MKTDPRKIDVEVLPPERQTQPVEPWMRIVAHLMDNAFRLPGTNFRFGLDPLLGLLPAFGDTFAGLISAVLISQGARYGLPKIVLVRMALNVLANTAVGAIPFVGDAFSFWFKSNARNYELFEKHRGAHRKGTTGDWLFVVLLVSVLLLLVILIVVGFISLIGALMRPPGL